MRLSKVRSVPSNGEERLNAKSHSAQLKRHLQEMTSQWSTAQKLEKEKLEKDKVRLDPYKAFPFLKAYIGLNENDLSDTPNT